MGRMKKVGDNEWWNDDELLYVIKMGLPTDRNLYSEEDLHIIRCKIALEKDAQKTRDKAKIKEILYGN